MKKEKERRLGDIVEESLRKRHARLSLESDTDIPGEQFG